MEEEEEAGDFDLVHGLYQSGMVQELTNIHV